MATHAKLPARNIAISKVLPASVVEGHADPVPKNIAQFAFVAV